MNNKNGRTGVIRKSALVLAVASLLPAAAFALPEVTEKQGWDGYVGFGAGYFDIKSNTIAKNKFVDLDNDRLKQSDLNNNRQGGSRSTAFPAINGEVRWTLPGRNQLFLGSAVLDAVTLDSAFQLGWRKTTENNGTFQLGLIFNRVAPLEVYEDPYKTGSKRDETDAYSTGWRFQFANMWGTPLEFQLTYLNISIDKDRAGEVFSILGPQSPTPAGELFLTEQQLKELERGARDVDVALGWLFDLGGGHSVRPMFGYTDRQADGDAETFDAGHIKVTYAYGGEKLDVVSSIAASSRKYDKRDPVFNDERNSDNLAINATVFYDMPWVDDDRWRVFGNVLWGEIDSDVDFYDVNTVQVAVGALYKFGGS